MHNLKFEGKQNAALIPVLGLLGLFPIVTSVVKAALALFSRGRARMDRKQFLR